MANYADILNVIFLYSHSLSGSTVRRIIPWLRQRVFIYPIHHRLCYCTHKNLL